MTESEQKLHVLIVDDHRINRLMLKMPLKKAHYEVSLAAGGSEALDLLQLENKDINTRPPFDLIVLDIMMPDISGIDVLKKVREIYPPEVLPIIMATALKESKDIVEALDLGANDYVTKPIDLPVLLARVQVHIKLHQTHIKLQQAQASLLEEASHGDSPKN